MKIIISLDGGGIRGLVQAAILDYLEKKIQEIQEDNRIRLGNLVDFVAGTSTGSIVGALMILHDDKIPTRPKYYLSDIVKLYVTIGPKVFRSRFFHNLKTVWGLFGPKFPASNIEGPLIEMLDHYKLEDLIKPCLFTGYDIDKRRINIYTNQDIHKKYGSYYLKDIIRGSTAIPSYFPPAYFREDLDINTIVDGGTFANNPSMVSYVECQKTIFPPNKEPLNLTPDDILLISLGSGRSHRKSFPYNKAKRFGLVQWAMPILDVLLSGSSDVVDTEVKNLFDVYKRGDNYKRINPPLNYSTGPATDASEENITNLLKDASDYIEKNQAFLNTLAREIIDINNLLKL